MAKALMVGEVHLSRHSAFPTDSPLCSGHDLLVDLCLLEVSRILSGRPQDSANADATCLRGPCWAHDLSIVGLFPSRMAPSQQWLSVIAGGRQHNRDSRGGNSRRRPLGPQKRQPSVSVGDDLSEVWYDDSIPRWRQHSSIPSSEKLQRQRPLLIDAEWEDRQQRQQPHDRAEWGPTRSRSIHNRTETSKSNFGNAGHSVTE